MLKETINTSYIFGILGGDNQVLNNTVNTILLNNTILYCLVTVKDSLRTTHEKINNVYFLLGYANTPKK